MKHIRTVVIVAALICTNAAYATVWYVHPDSVLNCIQHCLDSCSTGDTVLVGPGVYSEHIVWPSIQGIDLVSEYGVDMTYIDGGGTAIVIEINTGVDSTTMISGFTIQNGYPAGIYCFQNTSPTITGNTITNNTSNDHGGGIYCLYSSSPTITNNIITGNTGMWAGGIDCNQTSAPTITGNTITGNTSYRGAGISCYYGSSPTITDNTITQNTAAWTGGGIWCTVNCSPTITGNTITDNSVTGGGSQDVGGGICCMYNSSPPITDNTISNNSASAGGGILCYENSSPSIINNTITGNTVTAGGGGILIYQYCSPTITDNIITGNTAEGGGGLALQTTSSLVTGNTFSGNTADFGGGIHCTVDDLSTITSNIITGNTANSFAGGISCKLGASPVIEHCTIAGNYGDGIYCFEDANPTINHNNIIDNVGYGVRNISSITVNAEDNWWGDSTGPYHPTTNPGGLGDTVSDYVDFVPWMGEPGIEEYEISYPPKLNVQITPNPFTQFTNIRYTIHDARSTMQKPQISIYDASGRLVKSFNLESSIQGQESKVVWNGYDNNGKRVPAGTYFCRIIVGERSIIEKAILIE